MPAPESPVNHSSASFWCLAPLIPLSYASVLGGVTTLVFTGEVNKVQALQRFPGLTLFGLKADNVLATNLVEVVISHQSELPGKTLQGVDFRSMFSAGVVLENSGAAAMLAQGMQHPFSGYGVYAAFADCYCLTLLLTETVTNNAIAALAFPIA